MKHAKRIITIIIITILTISAVFISYIGIENGAVVFAEDISYMTDEELDAAINAYIQSKGGSMLGTIGARTAYAEGKLYNFLTSGNNSTPIKNIEDLKSGLSWNRQTIEGMDSKSALVLSVTPTANSFLASYLVWLRQQHYFGDNVTENENGMFTDDIDNLLYSGKYYQDAEEVITLAYVVDDLQSMSGNVHNPVELGTYYKYSTSELMNTNKTFTYNITNNYIYSDTVGSGSSNTGDLWYMFGTNNPPTATSEVVILISYKQGTSNAVIRKGHKAIFYYRPTDKYYFGHFLTLYDTAGQITQYFWSCQQEINLNDLIEEPSDTNIYFYTNNNNNVNVYPTINEGDNLYITPKVNVGVDGEVNYQPYIINEGDNITNIVNNYYNDSGTKDKTITVPSDDPGGGGSSDGPGGNLPNWENPYPHISPDGEGGFNFNFTLPDLNIDWNISGLTEKFPFSIPFDFVAFCRVLDADPETPELQCDIDLKLVTWHVDYNLHQFDDIASLLRNLEFIAFCIALVIMTRNMIKG